MSTKRTAVVIGGTFFYQAWNHGASSLPVSNTYKRKGLPPTPIASPGRASIIAALNPAPNPNASDAMCQGVAPPCRYLYYVLADKDGAHEFAATLEQHERNVEAARQAGILP